MLYKTSTFAISFPFDWYLIYMNIAKKNEIELGIPVTF